MALRALRRYHSRRMKAKAKRVYPDWPKSYKVADYIHCCSCYMCCNVRRRSMKASEKLTRQEQLAILRHREGLEE
jgi:hypothetical protein